MDDQVFPAQKRENRIMGSHIETYPAVAELVCATSHFLPDISQVPSTWVGATWLFPARGWRARERAGMAPFSAVAALEATAPDAA